MIGTVLGDRYELLEEIGKGGMAYVYKARCVLLNRIVAVKILRDDLESGDEFLKRFNVEAQSAASLTHQNIVSIFDVGVDKGKHYIVMEYIDGITLKEYIETKGNLEYEEALDIAYQISDALQAAHEKNIVHRDIKPHNILITDDGDAKVTDFGIARSTTTNTISEGTDILGSVHYISPEQARGEVVDNRSDLYSLGIVMYEMITGQVPFDSDTPVAVAMMQIDESPKDIELEYDLPEGVRHIIFKSISKDASLRYQSALDMKTDILNIIENPDYVIENGDLYTELLLDNDDSRKFNTDDSSDRPLSRLIKILMFVLAMLTSIAIVVIGIIIANIDSFM